MQDDSGVVGIVLVVILDTVLFLLAAFVLYAFLVRVHRDGSLMDLYRRLCSPDHAFNIPHDMEVRTLLLLVRPAVDRRIVPILALCLPLALVVL